MNTFEEGIKILEDMFGNGKDNLISLATVAREPGEGGKPRPSVRTVDAYYENGTFYAVSYAGSNKMQQIAQNPEISVAGHEEMFTASGTGENLGWVLAPQNAELRTKLRTAFSAWYDMANDESDKNCCILAMRLNKGILNVNHWEKLYHMDFVNKTELEDAGTH